MQRYASRMPSLLGQAMSLARCSGTGPSMFHSCASLGQEAVETVGETKVNVNEAVGLAYNHVERKMGLFKPKHSVEEQIAYMKSRAYEDSYKGLPVYRMFRRNVRGQMIFQPPPRLFCIDKEGKFNVNNACPICRDEYLFFDYRNPALIEQFVMVGSDQPLPLLKTCLCREQYNRLKAELLKAKEHGTIKFSVPFRNFNYSEWYPWWQGGEQESVSRDGNSVDSFHPSPLISFPTHSRDVGNNWDEWWLRYDKFVRRGK